MPFISESDRHLTVLNMFITDAREKQTRLLEEMRKIVDTADFPGWMSSTVHSAQDRPGTANFIQWRSREDLMLRYQDDKFQHGTVPLFGEISTSMKLLQTNVVFTERHPSLEAIEVSPARDDYTVIEFFGVAEEDQASLIDVLGPDQSYLVDTPGFRSRSVLKGIGARYYEGSFVVVYSQWDSKDSYDTYREQPAADWPEVRLKAQERADTLANHYEWNSYRVWHTRSAGE